MIGERHRRLLLGLDDPEAQNVRKVGNKFYGIARLYASGLPVPATFSIPSSIIEELCTPDSESSQSLDDLVSEASSVLPIDKGVAVRSSGMDEDLTTESGAGKYLTVLNVIDPQTLRQAILAVITHYQETRGSIPEGEPQFAVILQQMVLPSVSGVAFSRHPLQNDEDLVVLEAVEGLGDRLVSGNAKPLHVLMGPVVEFPLRAITGEILLNPAQLADIRGKVRHVECLWGCPVDVEWAIADEQLYLLQARPATAMTRARPPGIWTRGIAEDLWGDALCPLDASILLRLASKFDLRGYVRGLGIPVEDTESSIGVIDDYLYVNAGLLSRVVRSFPRGLDLSIVERIFPPDLIPEPQGKLWPLLLKAIYLLFSDFRANPLLCPLMTRQTRRRILNAMETRRFSDPKDLLGLSEDLKFLVDLEGEMLFSNQMPYFLAFILTWLAEHRFQRMGIPWEGGSGLVGCRNNPTFRMNVRLTELGNILRQYSFQGVKESDLPVEAAKMLKEFIKEFGCRSDSRSLADLRLAEDLLKVLPMARAAAAKPYPPIVERLSMKIPIHLRIITALARMYLELREDLRDTLDRLLWEERKIIQHIDKELGLEGSIYELSIDQVLSMAGQGAPKNTVWNPPYAFRRSKLHTKQFPPRFYVDGKVVNPGVGRTTWKGIPTSKGRARGRALVVHSLREAMMAEEGEILIAHSMGPSWTSILPRVAGVILAEGSMLNHFSIVAREYHVPCIVGVGQGVLEIQSFKEIEMDGYEGRIWVH